MSVKRPGRRDVGAVVTGGAIGGVAIALLKGMPSGNLKDALMAAVPMSSVVIAALLSHWVHLAEKRSYMRGRMQQFNVAKNYIHALVSQSVDPAHSQKLAKMVQDAERNLAKEFLEI
jgi:choline-glycine betaine transporter